MMINLHKDTRPNLDRHFLFWLVVFGVGRVGCKEDLTATTDFVGLVKDGDGGWMEKLVFVQGFSWGLEEILKVECC